MPFENPSGLVELRRDAADPADPGRRSRRSSGAIVGNRRQGWALYAAMLLMFVVGGRRWSTRAEAHGSPAQRALAGADAAATSRARRRASASRNSALCRRRSRRSRRAAPSTPPSTRSPASAALVPMFNMSTGEVIFGGVGSGLYGMLLFVLLAVFIAGLMVGPHARVPRQEDRGARGQARHDRDALRAARGARGHRARDRHQVGRAVDLQPGPAGLLGDALRLHLAGQQQRLGVRRLHRLRAAERARQRGRLRHHLRRPARRPGDAVRPLRAAASPRWRSPARSPPSASRRSAPAPSAPTPPRSWCC